MTKKEIRDICEKYNITNYTINPDGSIDVDGDVDLSGKDLIKIPLKFNKVNGWFDCSYNKLTSLEGCPSYVGISFNCSYNCLTTLENSPKKVYGSFNCYDNKLVNLKGIGEVNGYGIHCVHNPLESLEGYNGDLSKLYCLNKEKLIRKTKLKLLKEFYL